MKRRGRQLHGVSRPSAILCLLSRPAELKSKKMLDLGETISLHSLSNLDKFSTLKFQKTGKFLVAAQNSSLSLG